VKEQIIKIAQDLEKNKITTKTAKTLLLCLFGVSNNTLDEYDEIDITRCPMCGSSDHSMITGEPYKCFYCGTIFQH